MGYLYLNFVDNLNESKSGNFNTNDFFTQSLNEQYLNIKKKIGSDAPDTLQEFVGRCCPYNEHYYFISMPALERSIQTKIKKDGTQGLQYINNVVIRPTINQDTGIPGKYDVILIGDITFGSVIAFTVKGIELIDSGVAKFGEFRVLCTAAPAFATKTFSDKMGRTMTVPDFGVRETHDAVLTRDFIDRLCLEVYPIEKPEEALKTIEKWKTYLKFRRYYLGVQSAKCEAITDVQVKAAYVVSKAQYRKNEENLSSFLLDGHSEFAISEQVVLNREVPGSDEFPLICVSIERNRKSILTETSGYNSHGKPKYETYLGRYTRDSMGLSEVEPKYDDKGNLPKGFKFPYTLGDRHLLTFTDIEPDCSDLDIKCQRDIETSNKEVDGKYNSIITEEVKKYKLEQTPLVSAQFEEKLTLHSRFTNKRWKPCACLPR